MTAPPAEYCSGGVVSCGVTVVEHSPTDEADNGSGGSSGYFNGRCIHHGSDSFRTGSQMSVDFSCESRGCPFHLVENGGEHLVGLRCGQRGRGHRV